jgi:hypothetical protein
VSKTSLNLLIVSGEYFIVINEKKPAVKTKNNISCLCFFIIKTQNKTKVIISAKMTPFLAKKDKMNSWKRPTKKRKNLIHNLTLRERLTIIIIDVARYIDK